LQQTNAGWTLKKHRRRSSGQGNLVQRGKTFQAATAAQLSLRSSTPNKKFPYEKYRCDMRAEAEAAGGRFLAAFDLFSVCHNYLYIAYFPPRKLGVISEA
jgi:hypothetical protein